MCVPLPAVVELADRLLVAPIHATLDTGTFGPQTIESFGIDLRLVESRSVVIVGGEPLGMIPGVEEGDPPTNSFAGNSAFTSGAVLEVDHGSETSTVTLTLAASGADVLATMSTTRRYRRRRSRRTVRGGVWKPRTTVAGLTRGCRVRGQTLRRV